MTAPTTVPASGIYTGTLTHRRHRPARHAFRHGIYQVLLDLDDLSRLDREVAGFGYNRAALTSFHDADHLGDEDRGVREKLDRWLAARGVTPPGGPVRLLTNLRVFGYVFNPVSWFYCYEPDGTLAVIVAEVNNTFGDTYAYLLDDLQPAGGHLLRAGRPKVFHVSPFLGIAEHHYRFAFRPPGDRLAVHMEVLTGRDRVLDATFAGRHRPLTSRTLVGALLRYPLMSLRTIALIHWHALRLWAKRVPFHRRPAPPDPAGPARSRFGRTTTRREAA